MPIKNRNKGNQPKVFIGILNDVGGFIITVDLWGHAHIKRVPPRQPAIARLSSASALLMQADAVAHAGTRKQLRGFAEQILKDVVPALEGRRQ